MERGKLDEDSARYYFRQLVAGISYLHDNTKVAHRDMKFENSLLSDDTLQPTVKICDFGMSKELEQPAMTKLGTPNYRAPELYNLRIGEIYDAKKVDIWALGVMLYTMVVRQKCSLRYRPPVC